MSPEDVIRAIAARHLVTVDQLRARSRNPRFMRARIDVAQRLRFGMRLRVKAIARLLNRTPWTVGYYLDEEYRRRRSAKGITYYLWRKEAKITSTRATRGITVILEPAGVER